LHAGDIGRIIVFCGVTIFLGMFVLGDVALFARPDLVAELTGISGESIFFLAIVLALVPVVYLGLAGFVKRPLRLWRWSIGLPPLRIALAQLTIGTLNFLFVAACLHATVSSVADVGYFEVLFAFVLANTAAIVTHTPGGLGVIETVLLLLLGESELIGPILLFRFVYYLIPLGLGGLAFAIAEAHGAFNHSPPASEARSRSA
jgi:uncharacterized membrane protein YbhN (UPF0104 family)